MAGAQIKVLRLLELFDHVAAVPFPFDCWVAQEDKLRQDALYFG